MQRLAAKNDVPVRLNTIIYKLVDELKEELSRKIPPLVSQDVVGESETTKSKHLLQCPVSCVSLFWCRRGRGAGYIYGVCGQEKASSCRVPGPEGCA